MILVLIIHVIIVFEFPYDPPPDINRASGFHVSVDWTRACFRLVQTYRFVMLECALSVATL